MSDWDPEQYLKFKKRPLSRRWVWRGEDLALCAGVYPARPNGEIIVQFFGRQRSIKYGKGEAMLLPFLWKIGFCGICVGAENVRCGDRGKNLTCAEFL